MTHRGWWGALLTIHGVSLLAILGGGGDQMAGLAVVGRGHHPGLTLHHRAEHMLGLGGAHIACALFTIHC